MLVTVISPEVKQKIQSNLGAKEEWVRQQVISAIQNGKAMVVNEKTAIEAKKLIKLSDWEKKIFYDNEEEKRFIETGEIEIKSDAFDKNKNLTTNEIKEKIEEIEKSIAEIDSNIEQGVPVNSNFKKSLLQQKQNLIKAKGMLSDRNPMIVALERMGLTFDQLDRVVIPVVDYGKIKLWAEGKDMNILQLPLEAGIFVYGTEEIAFAAEPKTIAFAYRETGIYWLIDRELIDNKTFHISLSEEFKGMKKQQLKELAGITQVWMETMNFMRDYRNITEYVNESTIRAPRNKKAKKGKKQKKVTYLTRKVYNISLPKSMTPRQFTRHVDGWSVQGFWRHYKNGKKVWIRPHTRGNKKVQLESKEYRV